MAPPPALALRGVASSSSSSSSSPFASAFAASSSRDRLQLQLAPRGSDLTTWPEADVRAFAAVVDSAGHFNGSCRGEYTVESVVSGACAAAFEDVTTYCCGAVGGRMGNNTAGGVDPDNDGPEGVCHCTSYRTMLMCYDDIIHNACNLNLSPTGICKSNGTSDTSTLASSASVSPSLSRSPLGTAARQIAAPLARRLGGGPCSSSSSMRAGRRRTAADSATRLAATLTTSSPAHVMVLTLLASSIVLATIGVHGVV
ncbi:hypothetical protein OC844_007840 [Tilletia horrida]|nr:hypothetical protein OC844_007840 [Tilletia horrida]